MRSGKGDGTQHTEGLLLLCLMEPPSLTGKGCLVRLWHVLYLLLPDQLELAAGVKNQIWTE